MTMLSKYFKPGLWVLGAILAILTLSNGAQAQQPPNPPGCPPFCEGGNNSSLSLVNITNFSTSDAAKESQYDISIQVGKEIASGQKLQFAFRKKDGFCGASNCRADFSNSAFSSTTISGTYAVMETTDAPAGLKEKYGELTLTSKLAVGSYSFSLSKVKNPEATGNYFWAVSVDWFGAGAPANNTNSFDFPIFGTDFFEKPPESGCPPFCEGGGNPPPPPPGGGGGPADPGQDLTKRINLQGKVLDPDGNAVQGAFVDAVSGNFSSFYTGSTTETGEFAIRGMKAPETYMVKVHPPFGTGGLTPPAEVSITLENDSQLKIVNFAFTKAKKNIKGTVKDATGRAVNKARVNAFQFKNGNFQNTETSADGSYNLGVGGGDWEVMIEAGGGQFGQSDFNAADWVYMGTPKYATFNTDAEASEEVVMDWVVDRTNSSIKGQFVDSNAKGLKGFIELRNEKFTSSTQTSEDGKFSVGAPQGRVSLTFFPDDKSISSFETKIEVPGKGEVDIGQVALAGKESAITGRVVDSDGNAVSGVNLFAFAGGFGTKFEEHEGDQGGLGVPGKGPGDAKGPAPKGPEKFKVTKLSDRFTTLGTGKEDEKFNFKEGEQFKGDGDFDFDTGKGFELPEECQAKDQPKQGSPDKGGEKKPPVGGKSVSIAATPGQDPKVIEPNKPNQPGQPNTPGQPNQPNQPGQPNTPGGANPQQPEQPMCPDSEFIGDFTGGPQNFGFGDATTDADGKFSIPVNSGDYMVDVQFGGGSGVVPTSQPKSVTIESKESVDVGDIVVQVTNAKISVTVVDQNGSAYSDGFGFAHCDVAGSFGPGNFFGQPIINGKALISVVAGKKYSCNADVGGRDSNVSVDEAKSATPAVDETVTVQLVVLPNDATVQFTIKDQNGKVVSNPVEFFAMGIGEGNFTFRGTRSESGEGTVSLRGGKDYSFGMFVDNFGGKKTYMHTPPDPEPQTVPKNGTLKYSKTVFEANATVSVKVQNPDGSAAPFAFVNVGQFHLVDKGLLKPGDALESGQPTDSKGLANIPVAGGREYSIGVGIDPNQSALGYMMPAQELATVQVGRTVQKTIKYKVADASVSGTVKFEDGTKGQFGFCRAFSRGSKSFSGGELRDGKYAINVTSSDGPWVVNCNTHLPGLGYYESANVSVETPSKGKYSADLKLIAGGFDVPDAITTQIDGTSTNTVKLPDGSQLDIPAGAISQDTSITLTATPTVDLMENGEFQPLAYGYEFSAVASGKEIEEFDSKLTVTMAYSEKMLDAAGIEDEGSLKMKYFDDTATTWKGTDAVIVDEKKNTISAQVDHFSTFASLSDGGASDSARSKNIDNDATSTPKGGAYLAVTAKGKTSQLQLFDVKGKQKKSFYLFGETLTGNFEVVGGDLDGDDLRDYIAFPAQAGFGPQVRTFSGKGKSLGTFFAYATTDRGGVKAVAGDFDGDGVDEVAVAHVDGDSTIALFDYNAKKKTFSSLDTKLVFGATEKWGWSMDSGDIDGDGKDEIVVSKGKGGDSKVSVLTYDTKKKDLKELFKYEVFPAGFTGGLHTQVGDVDGDGKEEAVHVPVSGAANVQVFGANAKNKKMGKETNGFALPETYTAGSTIEVGEVTGDGNADVIVFPGVGGGSNLRVYSVIKGKLKLHSWLLTYDSSVRDGGIALAVDMKDGDSDKEVVVVPVGERSVNARIYDFTTSSLDKNKKPKLLKSFYTHPETTKVQANISW